MDIAKFYPSDQGFFKNRTAGAFFSVECFAYFDSDICMVDSCTAQTFSAVHDKLHILIQSDSSRQANNGSQRHLQLRKEQQMFHHFPYSQRTREHFLKILFNVCIIHNIIHNTDIYI